MEVHSSAFNRLVLYSDSVEDDPASTHPRLELELDSGIVIEERDIPPSSTVEPQPLAESNSICQGWKVFATTFATIFLAELGDKTQVSTLLMSAEFHAPWVVFTGAAAALIATSLLGVLVGRWLSTRLSPRTLDTAAGITLALISVWLLWDVLSS